MAIYSDSMESAKANDGPEWLTLQEASEYLGVTTSTVRRWGDSGKIPMRRTMGGHRRFPRAALTLMATTRAGNQLEAVHPVPKQPWPVDGGELARQGWHARFMAHPAADRMRGLGQRLLGLLIQYINNQEEQARFLMEAHAVGVTYGGEACVAAISMHDMVEAFLFFRHAFSQLAMPLPGMAQPSDLTEASVLRGRIDHFMDAILLGSIAGYEQQALSPCCDKGEEAML